MADSQLETAAPLLAAAKAAHHDAFGGVIPWERAAQEMWIGTARAALTAAIDHLPEGWHFGLEDVVEWRGQKISPLEAVSREMIESSEGTLHSMNREDEDRFRHLVCLAASQGLRRLLLGATPEETP